MRDTVLAGLGAVALAAGAVPAAAQPVHLRGTAYEFNDVKVRLGGAQVRVAEDPTLGATVKADGRYDLEVPDGRRVTPYINAAGHHTIYLQTFTTGGQDLERVNFQVPSDAIYRALAALLSVPVGADGNPVGCAIVSTFSTRDVRDVGFDAFTGYGAHGIAGATAFATPALPAPIYFNKQVVPDRAQPSSSEDGGVIWPVVAPGTYTIHARHRTTAFAPFTATCAAGRIVNANPPWGLHQLGKANPTTIRVRRSGDRIAGLRLTEVPRGAAVTATCSGTGCPFTTRTLARAMQGPTLTLALPGRGIHRAQTLSVLVTAHAHDGRLVRFTGGTSTTLCVPLGETKPRKRCP
ncbi:MAG: hypothetical protein JWR63_391 [Conexibacter sp.]|nr:hypothetical protein [Conexibacter sp.]